jgi:hypothetical protein
MRFNSSVHLLHLPCPPQLLVRHEGRPAAGEEPSASREGISPACGSSRQMRDVGAIVRWGQEGCTYVYRWSMDIQNVQRPTAHEATIAITL